MEKKDIAAIILIASLGVVVSYLVVINIPFLRIPEDGIKVQTIPTISSEVVEPDSKIFNAEAINPTVEIVVGNGETEN